MTHFQIVSRWDETRVLYEGEAETLKDLVGTAVSAGAYLAGAYLDGANLDGANLAGAYLAGANLDGANLARANLARANLDGANLARANLAGAYLARANLARANLARANLARANLARANLARANLARANLAGAYLAGANGEKLTLVGDRPVLQIGPLGSRCAYLIAYLTDAGVYVRAGCFWGTLAAFKAAVAAKHAGTVHATEYAAACRMIEVHAKLWTPKVGKATKKAKPATGKEV